MRKLWRLWALSLGEKLGDNNREADIVASMRSAVVLLNLITCLFIIAGVGSILRTTDAGLSRARRVASPCCCVTCTRRNPSPVNPVIANRQRLTSGYCNHYVNSFSANLAKKATKSHGQTARILIRRRFTRRFIQIQTVCLPSYYAFINFSHFVSILSLRAHGKHHRQ